MFGAVSALAANVGVMEAIKLIIGMEPSLAGQMLYYDMQHMSFQKIAISQIKDCPVCCP